MIEEEQELFQQKQLFLQTWRAFEKLFVFLKSNYANTPNLNIVFMMLCCVFSIIITKIDLNNITEIIQ